MKSTRRAIYAAIFFAGGHGSGAPRHSGDRCAGANAQALEALAAQAGVDTRGAWERPMQG